MKVLKHRIRKPIHNLTYTFPFHLGDIIGVSQGVCVCEHFA